MVELKELASYTSGLLDIDAFQDYAPNGLQVEGRATVKRLVSAVTASLDVIEAAIAIGADALLVHHGYFWKGEDACISGMKRRRLGRLLAQDISLLAYHLPLDAHPHYGNNACLAGRLGLKSDKNMMGLPGQPLVSFGKLAVPMTAQEFSHHLMACLDRVPLHIPGEATTISTIGWCSGAAQGYFERAARQGIDAYLTGEVSEQTTHIAREYGVHFFAAGHHATERYGVQALGAHLAQRFSLDHRYIEIDNPV